VLNPPVEPKIAGVRDTLDIKPAQVPRTPCPPRDIFSSMGQSRSFAQVNCSEPVKGVYPFSPTRGEMMRWPNQARTSLFATPRRLVTLGTLRDSEDPMSTMCEEVKEVKQRFNKAGVKFSREMDRLCSHSYAYSRAEGTVRPLVRSNRNWQKCADTFQAEPPPMVRARGTKPSPRGGPRGGGGAHTAR
jgi:hypothetical protein